MLAFYDSELNLLGSDPIRSIHNGHLGGSYETTIYIRNNNSLKYYTNLLLSISTDLGDSGELGTTGWGVKLLYGSRRPTEAEWSSIRSNSDLTLPDVGSTIAADTYTYHPIWVRVFCPANTGAQIRESQSLILSFFERNVGA